MLICKFKCHNDKGKSHGVEQMVFVGGSERKFIVKCLSFCGNKNKLISKKFYFHCFPISSVSKIVIEINNSS